MEPQWVPRNGHEKRGKTLIPDTEVRKRDEFGDGGPGWGRDGDRGAKESVQGENHGGSWM